MKNSTTTRRQSWYRFVTTVLIVALVAMVGMLLARPAPVAAPTVSEIATAINGPVKFERPSAMEYVSKTNSCVVGGNVLSTQWHVGAKSYPVAMADSETVDYTSFQFRSDEGRTFTVLANGALWTTPGENLGLQLYCDLATIKTAPSFGMIAIIWGGK